MHVCQRFLVLQKFLFWSERRVLNWLLRDDSETIGRPKSHLIPKCILGWMWETLYTLHVCVVQYFWLIHVSEEGKLSEDVSTNVWRPLLMHGCTYCEQYYDLDLLPSPQKASVHSFSVCIYTYIYIKCCIVFFLFNFLFHVFVKLPAHCLVVSGGDDDAIFSNTKFARVLEQETQVTTCKGYYMYTCTTCTHVLHVHSHTSVFVF